MEGNTQKAVICQRCILTSDDGLDFKVDEKGICIYCKSFDELNASLGSSEVKEKFINQKVSEIKVKGQGKKYDCILGLSGGVDSSFLAKWASEQGLRPLVIHFDNGWNSELAVENIRQICTVLNFDLNTFVINWEEFKELQLAYLRAGVVDIEVLTDHAIMATIMRFAKLHGIRYTLNGFNIATEAIMPKGWVFDKSDWDNIKDIYKFYGSGVKIKTYPHISFMGKLVNHWFYKFESIQVLNYIPYNKFEAKRIIANELHWRDYGGKHYESVFTKFYQAYILPTKFKIDKRRPHLANLICSGQITKVEALKELEIPLYQSNVLEEEKLYVLKKLGLKEEEFDAMMKAEIRKHQDFATESKKWKYYFRIVDLLKFKF